MTTKEINEAIARACPDLHARYFGPCWTPEVFGYTTDLNVIREVEMTLSSSGDLASYMGELDRVCVPTHICQITHWQAVVMATARQRAEAFLRVKGLWK